MQRSSFARPTAEPERLTPAEYTVPDAPPLGGSGSSMTMSESEVVGVGEPEWGVVSEATGGVKRMTSVGVVRSVPDPGWDSCAHWDTAPGDAGSEPSGFPLS